MVYQYLPDHAEIFNKYRKETDYYFCLFPFFIQDKFYDTFLKNVSACRKSML
jgi:hypothetical protein